MLTRRSLLVLPAALLLLAGCSNAKPAATGPLPAPAPLLEQSSAHTKEQTSVHIKLSTTGLVPGVKIRTLEGDLTNKPQIAAKGSAEALFSDDPKQAPTKLQFIVAEGTIYAAIGGKWSGFGPVDNVYPVGNILDPNIGLANIVAHIKNPVVEDREQVNGTQVVRVAGQVDAEVLKSIFPGADHELPAKAWIREDGNHELVKSLIQVTPDSSIEILATDWGKPVSVSKPQ